MSAQAREAEHGRQGEAAEADGADEALLLELEELPQGREHLLVARSADRPRVLVAEAPALEVLVADLAVVADLEAFLTGVVELLADKLDVVAVDAVEVVGAHELHAALDARTDALGRVVEAVFLCTTVAADLCDDLVRLARELVADGVKDVAEDGLGRGVVR